MFVWKVMTAEKAQKLLRRHVMDNVQKYIIKQIKTSSRMGHDTVLLFNFPSSLAMDKKAFEYLKTFEGKWWLENLGYNIEEVMEEELIIKW